MLASMMFQPVRLVHPSTHPTINPSAAAYFPPVPSLTLVLARIMRRHLLSISLVSIGNQFPFLAIAQPINSPTINLEAIHSFFLSLFSLLSSPLPVLLSVSVFAASPKAQTLHSFRKKACTVSVLFFFPFQLFEARTGEAKGGRLDGWSS